MLQGTVQELDEGTEIVFVCIGVHHQLTVGCMEEGERRGEGERERGEEGRDGRGERGRGERGRQRAEKRREASCNHLE